ncbi:MAG: PAS domain-containing hybrid sensor histidine kinase/response regulator [Proteobacteria bacterium]|nr:PAS domain-containing hybrid sensor histidine kinase/response regulator [Pseudomonadota bacterium]
MLSTQLILLAGVVWLGLLFGVALYGERHAHAFERRWAIVYALSLGVHCTSWTFYGTLTQASRSGWWLPPTFVGAIALYAVGAALLVRLVDLAREVNAGSLADLIAARLGRHSGLAAVVTAVMLLGIVPYIALQLKAVAMSYGTLSGAAYPGVPAWRDSALWAAALMALFAMLFGTRRAAATSHNRGLVLALAFESLFKLGAMLALGTLLFLPSHLPTVPAAAAPPHDTAGFPALILLGALAMFTQPHQFHVGIVECRQAGHVSTARWMFPLYLLLIALPILPLARLGDAALRPIGVPSDLYMLALPLVQGHEALTVLAFLGGLSAATSMVVVATLALSLMVANHFVAPLLVRARWGRDADRADLRGAVLGQRRLAIAAIIALAWFYSRLLAGNDALADIGAISFSALAGLAPATLVALYRPQLGARAVAWGLVAGTAVWLYVLAPGIFAVAPAWFAHGPAGIAWLAPDQLLGFGDWSRLGRAVTLGLAANVAVVLLVARTRYGRDVPSGAIGAVDIAQLRALALRFLPGDSVDAVLGAQAPGGRARPAQIAAIEHELAALIGVSSARLLLDVMRHKRHGELDAVAAIVDEAAQDLRFNQRVLGAALANMSQGICVVDAQLRVVAWNRRYAELFAYPAGLLEIGAPVAALVRHNIRAGLIGDGEVEARLARRLAHMRAGTPHLSERRFFDGTVVEIRGNPMPDGGYVATFTDVTAFREAEVALRSANETLEQRVAARTLELAAASEAAQSANAAKSHFLAAVSHDLLQPLHAAQLFAHALRPAAADAAAQANARHLDDALGATENLLAGLLDIARLEGGRLHPQPRAFALADVLDPLIAEFRALAAARGVQLHVVGTRAWVRSDPQLLRRVLQNFLSNAIRYSERGRALIGCRRVRGALRVEVWDSGPGIDAAEQRVIFEQFRRGSGASGQGLGLGLAIAERIAGLLEHALTLRSWPGRGSVFAVALPRAAARVVAVAPAASVRALPAAAALVLDNEPAALDAMRALLESWDWRVHGARTATQALAAPATVDVLLLDYHLDGGATGVDALPALRARFGDVPAIVLTADRDPQLRRTLVDAGLQVLYKPVKPLALRQVLLHVLDARADTT